ncbi:MAG: glycosyltransferase [Candidatus Lindowbacteria bacterium]|nr:glycosyltransferase [Candidatus Lindowbacteria bacterium]
MENAESAPNRSIRRYVCVLTNAYPDYPDSNRVVFIRNLAQFLSQKGWTVSVVAPRIYSDSRSHEWEDGIEVRRFASFMGNKLLVEYSGTPIFRLMGYMAAGVAEAVRCVRARKCGLIHAHWVIPAGLIALIAGAICRKPVIVTAHDSDILVAARENPIMKRLAGLVLKRADGVTSVAEHLSEIIAEMGIPREKVVTFPMSVVTDSFTHAGPLHEDWAGEQVIFSNRSLYPVYNVETLARAIPAVLEKFPRVKTVIAGEGPEAQQIVAITRETRIEEHVRFAGAIAHERMPEYLRAASVYVSTALSDGASVSLLEAMACGTFPVVADIPANREWIRDGENGLLFTPGNAQALAEKIMECLGRPALREQAREINVKDIQQRAQWNSNVGKLLELYEKAMIR